MIEASRFFLPRRNPGSLRDWNGALWRSANQLQSGYSLYKIFKGLISVNSAEEFGGYKRWPPAYPGGAKPELCSVAPTYYIVLEPTTATRRCTRSPRASPLAGPVCRRMP